MGFVVANELETFIGLVERKIQVEGTYAVVDRANVKTFDEEARDFGEVTNRYIGVMIPFNIDGKAYTFFIDSDTYGNGGFDWAYGDTAEELFNYFEAEFLEMSED